MVVISIRCPVNPSEDPDKVRRAVLSIFPDAELEERDGSLSGSAPGMDTFHHLIRKQRILDATRAMLFAGLRNGKTKVMLNKQVATVGKVSFADRNPVLGAIEVTIESDDIEAFIDRLAPVTVDGEEVV